MVDIQKLVDELADRLQRSVAVDGPRGHLIASSKHFGDEDTPRVNVVLSRNLDRRIAQYLFSFGIQDANDKVVIPAEPKLGLKSRCCYPLRYQQRLLGFIWLIEDVGHEHVIRPYVEQIAEALGQEHDSSTVSTRQLEELGERLLRSSQHTVERAVEALRECDFPPAGSHVRLLAVAQTLHHDRGVSFPLLRSSTAAREWQRGGRELVEVKLASAVVLICAARQNEADGVHEFGQQLAAELTPADIRVGISERDEINGAPRLLKQAVHAAFASHLFQELDPVNAWSDIFPHRLIIEAALAIPQNATPPQSMAALFDPENAALLETVETYLDHGGDRAATAEALFIHRSTLYYRLSQVQKLTQLDPADGRNRLALHLAVKLNRVASSGISTLLQSVEDSG
ncbi:PucR family transcriptional regulator [Leucobacter coleopterorum]|uniref:PucR family transcriptional regulator n=1 Tax=Leucobacter coleopterorum TaxID=2714933 RepID=A0ABX6K322_9MICO|nr:PucR family transcriptional regulator [Leucobacter coleopterorum]QIM19575.1 PucR family transcriptional regulator [Leucobacter coleopterorum]